MLPRNQCYVSSALLNILLVLRFRSSQHRCTVTCNSKREVTAGHKNCCVTLKGVRDYT